MSIRYKNTRQRRQGGNFRVAHHCRVRADLTVPPDWVAVWDTLARWDKDLETVFCRECGSELKSLSWAKEHAERHFGRPR